MGYRQLEELGAKGNPELVETLLGAPYKPNRFATDYNQEDVVAAIREKSPEPAEHAPSERYARLVYCGLSSRDIPKEYVQLTKQHLEHLGMPESAFSCNAELLQPRLDLHNGASQVGKVVNSSISGALGFFISSNQQELQRCRHSSRHA